MKTLKIADRLALPVDVVTQTIAILAKRRAGKSYTMRRLVEQLFKAGQQVVLVDPKGDQWGVRSGADGKYRDGNGICALCGDVVDAGLKYPHPMAATVDHITPISKGGIHHPSNWQLAHARCNASKGNRQGRGGGWA